MHQGDLRSLRLAYWTFERAQELDANLAEVYAEFANAYAIDWRCVDPVQLVASAHARALPPRLSHAERSEWRLRGSTKRIASVKIRAKNLAGKRQQAPMLSYPKGR